MPVTSRELWGVAGNGRAVACSLPPHPNLLPRGEGTRGGVGVSVESGGHQSSRDYFHRRWERSSLSPRERARVRENDALPTLEIIQITCGGLAALIAVFRTAAAASGDASYLA